MTSHHDMTCECTNPLPVLLDVVDDDADVFAGDIAGGCPSVDTIVPDGDVTPFADDCACFNCVGNTRVKFSYIPVKKVRNDAA